MQVVAHYARLEEQWQFHNDKIVSLRKVVEHLLVQPLVDVRMGNLIQLPPLVGIREYYVAQGSPIEGARVCEHVLSKGLLNLLPRRLVWLNDCKRKLLINFNIHRVENGVQGLFMDFHSLSLAIWSASTTGIPASRNTLATVLLPVAIPPVMATINMIPQSE